MLRVGCAEKIIDVPLFAELYGYGHFDGRRNQGVQDPLYARGYSFFDGKKRALIIYSDICVSNTEACRVMRSEISARFRLDPDGIAFVATHTHCAPPVGYTGYTFGVADPVFQENWRRAVLEVAEKALLDEEEIVSATAGKAPLAAPIGRNRVDREKNVTDDTIRWVKLCRADKSVKLLLHNHGVHGISSNGPMVHLASADWMGFANQKIKEQKLADMPLFLLGPAGDINPTQTCLDVKSVNGNECTATPYLEYLVSDFDKGEKIDLSGVDYKFETVEMPTVPQSVAELRADAQALRDTDKKMNVNYWSCGAKYIDEMALLAEKGYGLGAKLDFQVIKIGDFAIYFVPGELYIAPGRELLARAKVKYPLIATVSNADGGYFFDETSAKRYPNAMSKDDRMFGFYEIYGYMYRRHFKYCDNVAEFVINQLLKMEEM